MKFSKKDKTMLMSNVESSLFDGDPCLWLPWVTLAHEFTSQQQYIQAFIYIHKNHPSYAVGSYAKGAKICSEPYFFVKDKLS